MPGSVNGDWTCDGNCQPFHIQTVFAMLKVKVYRGVKEAIAQAQQQITIAQPV
jgi:hypothetical protein